MMINLTENEQLGLILPYLYDEYDIGAVEQLIDETFSIDNLSELSIKSQHLITDAAKKHGFNVSFKTTERMKLYNSIIDAHFEGVEKPTGKPKLGG